MGGIRGIGGAAHLDGATDPPGGSGVPAVRPAGEAWLLAAVALAVTTGFAVWLATLPEVLDTLWLFVVVQVLPLTVREWHGFRVACFGLAGAFVPLAVIGALFGWFLLLPAALLLVLAGALAGPRPEQWREQRRGAVR